MALMEHSTLSEEEKKDLRRFLGSSGLDDLESRVRDDHRSFCNIFLIVGVLGLLFTFSLYVISNDAVSAVVVLLVGGPFSGILLTEYVNMIGKQPLDRFSKYAKKVLADKRAQEQEQEQEQERKERERAVSEVAKHGFTLDGAYSYYKACLEHQIPDLDTEARRQKALLLAKSKEEWNFPNIDAHYQEMFRSGQEREEQSLKQQREKELAEKIKLFRPVEQASVRLNDNASKLSGQEKRRYILQTQLDDAKKRLNNAEAEQEAEKKRQAEAQANALMAQAILYQALSEKEQNWGVPAGLANGIAGPGAGFAVASEIQAKNAAIRQRNESLKNVIFSNPLPTATPSSSGLLGLRREVSTLERQLEELKIKLTDEKIPAQTLMDALEVSATSAMTETGAVMVGVNVRAKKDFLIAGEAKAVIDGSFLAELRHNGEIVGNAYILLPTMGACVADGEIKLMGYCLKADGNQKYEIQLLPNRLWLIER